MAGGTVFVATEDLHLKPNGKPLAPEEHEHMLIASGMKSPRIVSTGMSSKHTRRLFRCLQNELPETDYVAALLCGGNVL